MIRRIQYKDIDFEKYSQCINQSVQKNWYVRKDVLDVLSGKWEILVFNDYEAVMPINLKRKLGFTFVHMPLFCQQMGVFSKEDNPELNTEFLNFLKKKYRVFLYSFNHLNQFKTELEKRKNYIIPLSDYEILKRKKYFKGRKSTVKWSQHLDFKELELNKETLLFIKNNFKGISKPSDFTLFENYISFLKKSNALKLCGVFHQNMLINLAVLVDEGSQFSLLGLINDDAFKNENGPSFLIDKILEKNIHQTSFNFMGSNIRGIEVFFKSFGAELADYSFLEDKFLKKFI